MVVLGGEAWVDGLDLEDISCGERDLITYCLATWSHRGDILHAKFKNVKKATKPPAWKDC